MVADDMRPGCEVSILVVTSYRFFEVSVPSILTSSHNLPFRNYLCISSSGYLCVYARSLDSYSSAPYSRTAANFGRV